MERTMSNNGQGKNVVVWFEIPASDFGRAVGFYETIFATRVKREELGDAKMAVFPYEQPGVGGSVKEAPNLAGKDSGTVVYLNCDGHLADVVDRVEKAGGALLTPRIDLPEG